MRKRGPPEQLLSFIFVTTLNPVATSPTPHMHMFDIFCMVVLVFNVVVIDILEVTI